MQTDQLDKGSEFPLVDEIATYSESDVEPGDIGPDCVSLPDAVEQGLVSATIDDFENISDPEYYGEGTLVLTNLTSTSQDICIPYGTTFTDETQDGVQDMAIFPSQEPDPNDLEEPEVLPESGRALSQGDLWAIALLAVGVLLVIGGGVLRRLSRVSIRSV